MRLLLSSAAHPRACGENDVRVFPTAPASGSSPRVRGKLSIPYANADGVGLIPARAGKTGGAAPRRAVSRAHPRACGENVTLAVDPSRTWGSSPRVRGKHVLRDFDMSDERLIPARAGKTRRARRW